MGKITTILSIYPYTREMPGVGSNFITPVLDEILG
jgi:hypothetical protein